MKRSVLALSILVAATASSASLAAPAEHATPAATTKKVHVTPELQNPGRTHASPSPRSGQACASGRLGVQAANGTNPATGKKKPAPVVVVPVGNGADTVQNATTRAQQVQSCVHATH